MNKEKPILFSAPMVRAILEGRKTQTRRIVKLRGNDGLQSDHSAWRFCEFHDEPRRAVWQNRSDIKRVITERCPYGESGDRLWVKETWQSRCWTQTEGNHIERVLYAADHSMLEKYVTGDWSRPKAGLGDKFVTPLFMPRWASRLLLENTEIHVERLQDITERDIIAEGCPKEFLLGTNWFQPLWESINGAGSWDKNPWVWVVSFKRV